jgi:vitamin K-dependent gamma-carboxylase
MGPLWANLCQRLFAPTDIASLVVFRIAFGAIMVWEVWRFFEYGRIARYYIDPSFYFTYFGFHWVRPWPGDGMYHHFWLLGVLAACITVGALYRVSAALFFLGITYVFLLDQTTYLNHMYLVSLVSFLMVLVPAHRWLSVDTWAWPGRASTVVPAWALWILRFQIAIPYTYGGIAKLNGDWLQGEPVRMWLSGRSSYPYIGHVMTSEWMVGLIAYGGLLFDLAVVPMLLWRRTRMLAYVLAVAFHLSNAYLFNIGIFPWFMIAATLLFFPPDWPKTLWGRAHGLVQRAAAAGRNASATLSGAAVEPASSYAGWRGPGRREALLVGFLGLYVAAQVLLPFRNWLYPGNVAWTEEGHRFSWRMKLRDKSHRIIFIAHSPSSGRTWALAPRDYLTGRQEDALDGHPDMIIQLAHHMADDMRARGHADIQVRVRALTSLNGRQPQDMIDPSIDLTTRHRSIWPADWIVPLTEPLRRT